MVKKEEIEQLSHLIKIEIKDPQKYIKQVEQIITYFDTLDKVTINSDEILTQELTLQKLREDKYIPYEENLAEKLKHTNEKFIKAPKI